jgi:hypothetical protein
MPYRAIKANIAESLDIIVQIERRLGYRFVSEVMEIQDYKPEYDQYDLVQARSRLTGQVATTRCSPRTKAHAMPTCLSGQTGQGNELSYSQGYVSEAAAFGANSEGRWCHLPTPHPCLAIHIRSASSDQLVQAMRGYEPLATSSGGVHRSGGARLHGAVSLDDAGAF